MRNTLTIFTILVSVIVPAAALHAQESSDIQKDIETKTAEIQALQKEIELYQAQVNQVAGQANTLQGALSTINKNQTKLKTDLTLTTKKVEKTELTIKQNQNEIGSLGNEIVSNTTALNETIRALNTSDNKSLLEMLASKMTISEFMRDVDEIVRVQKGIRSRVTNMRVTKQTLEQSQQTLAQQKEQLSQLTDELADKKKIVDEQANEKSTLLAQTRNQEAAYRAELEARKKQVEALTAEIFSYESKLKFTLSSKSLPKKGSLVWPVSDVLITQQFGKTADSGRLYAAGTHSGTDFRAAVGTPIYAVADGVVEGVGDTDKTCYKASFGKWVFIRHDNGLATAYGHLSVIKATEGQKVKAGDLIAYSGNTGHSTGPHLHLTVYASNGVDGEEGARVADRPSEACKGKNYRMPIAPTSAYLDPLAYLPKATSKMFKSGGHDSYE